MKTRYKTLFTLTVAHPYYRESSRDIDFIIPSETGERLKDGKLLIRENAGKLSVLFEAGEDGAALAPLPGARLRLGLKLANPFFSHITEVGADFAVSASLYRNTTQPTALDSPVKRRLTPPVFSHPLGDAARPVDVLLKNDAEQTIQLDRVTAPMEVTAISYDLTRHPPGTYTVHEFYSASSQQTTPYYQDPELFHQGVFGILEIQLASGFYTTAAGFQVAFEARKETLKYYVVAANYTDADLSQLAVTDQGFTSDQRPQIHFDKVLSNAFTPADLSPTLLGGGTAPVVLFKSQVPVDRTEKARRKIQLHKNGSVLINHLPQPRANQPNAHMIIPIAKPKP